MIPILEARDITKRYGPRDALVSVDVCVRAGELHGLLGPNGAGKTTLLRVLFGLVRRDAGRVTMFGLPHNADGSAVPDGLGGFVETPRFYPYLTGAANLRLLARLDGAPMAGVDSIVQDALDRTDLRSHANVRVAHYSAGIRQRLGVAAALLRRPRLLLLDEPTSALDPAAARDVRGLAKRLASDGIAILWSSHDMDEVEQLCGAVTILDAGRAVFAGTIDALRQRASAAEHLLRTSDDTTAQRVATAQHGVSVSLAQQGGGLEVTADQQALDAYVLALADAGIAVRALEPRGGTLESLFLQLTSRPRQMVSS